MASRTIQIFTTLNAGATDTTSSPAIPNSQTWVIGKAIFADINMGDNKSSTYLLEFGNGASWTIITAFAITGDTREVLIDKEVVGNGTKVLRLTRKNNSATNKICPCEIIVYEKL